MHRPAAERLGARADVLEIGRRHANHYRTLAERADRPMRRGGHAEWAERLRMENGNIAASVRWYLAHDREPLPHLFRLLALFWLQRDPVGETRAWIDQLTPAADSLDPQARAELLWTRMVTSLEAGDDAAALDARARLSPLLDEVSDAFLQAVCELAVAWSAPIVGDTDGMLEGALAAAERLRSQDEPYWRSEAIAAAGAAELIAGRDDDALRHLRESGELADRVDSTWLTARSRWQLGLHAVLTGRLEDARPLLTEGLSGSLAAHSTPLVTLCILAFARLAFAEGEPERAALLVGAGDGLRRRAGVRAWPRLRAPEQEFAAQMRDAIGADRFDQVSAAGSRLSQQEAVAAVRDG